MTYPRHANKQGPERIRAGNSKNPGTPFNDPLAAPKGANVTSDHYDRRVVPPEPKPGGGEGQRAVAPYAHPSSRDTEPAARNVTSPGKIRRVQP